MSYHHPPKCFRCGRPAVHFSLELLEWICADYWDCPSKQEDANANA